MGVLEYLCGGQHDDSDQDDVDVGSQRTVLIDLINLEEKNTTGTDKTTTSVCDGGSVWAGCQVQM